MTRDTHCSPGPLTAHTATQSEWILLTGDHLVNQFLVLFLALEFPSNAQIVRIWAVVAPAACCTTLIQLYHGWVRKANDTCRIGAIDDYWPTMLDDAVVIVVIGAVLTRHWCKPAKNELYFGGSAKVSETRPLIQMCAFLSCWTFIDAVLLVVLDRIEFPLCAHKCSTLLFACAFPGVVYYCVAVDSLYWANYAQRMLEAAQDSDDSCARLPISGFRQFQSCLIRSWDQSDDVLGIGSEAVVYKGAIGTKFVAIKKWELSRCAQEAAQSAIRESVLLLHTTHPNIIKLEGLCVEPPDICMLLEYCEHGDLHACVTRNKAIPGSYWHGSGELGWLQRLFLCAGCAAGMDALHQANIVHRWAVAWLGFSTVGESC